jgi:SpoVK/Ycf46/Vps4 family AAA+-type ATPase
MALDRNARAYPHLFTVATSNFTLALDEAFRSRADVSIEMPLPDQGGALAILQRTLADFGQRYRKLGLLAQDPHLMQVAGELVGLDGRRIRKVVTEALAGNRATVLDPDKLRTPDLLAAARRLGEAEQMETARAAA